VRARLRRLTYTSSVLVVTVLAQVPLLLAIGRLSGAPWATGLFAALLLVPSAACARNPWEHRPRSRLELYGFMWPFFVWWTICLVFFFLAPIVLALAWLTPLFFDQALEIGAAAALLLGVRALSRRPRIRVHKVAVPGLPAAFTGYRIAQISDIHCGPFTPPVRVRRWVDKVNALNADLVTVTGDLITRGPDYVPAVAACLGRLRARDGAYGCMGNHDYFTDGEAFARELVARGLKLLRNRGVVLERDGCSIYLAGVDDTWTHKHNLEKALRDRPAGAPVVLLAHDPALFPEAAARGVALTLSGHTHGGQFALPVAPRRVNLARLMTPFTVDLYKIGSSLLYVNRGLGTTGPPIRLGARPEIALFTLVPADVTEQAAGLAHLAEEVIREASDVA
jgi:uncharacterized protein